MARRTLSTRARSSGLHHSPLARSEGRTPGLRSRGRLLITTDTHELFTGTGTGIVRVGGGEADAKSIQGIPVSAQAPEDGELLIFDGASGKYVPGDPIVSGPDAPGSSSDTSPVQIGIFDGMNVRRLAGNSDGAASIEGSVEVSNFPDPHPVSAESLPLPAGAAKETGGNSTDQNRAHESAPGFSPGRNSHNADASNSSDGGGDWRGGRERTCGSSPGKRGDFATSGWRGSGWDGRRHSAIDPRDGYPRMVALSTEHVKGTLTDDVRAMGRDGGTCYRPAGSATNGREEVAPVVKPIWRKSTVIQSTTPLAGGASFYSRGRGLTRIKRATRSYVREATRTKRARTVLSSSKKPTTRQIPIFFKRSLLGRITMQLLASSICALSALIRARYWRVQYTNGATLQTSFELTTTACSIPPMTILGGVCSGIRNRRPANDIRKRGELP